MKAFLNSGREKHINKVEDLDRRLQLQERTWVEYCVDDGVEAGVEVAKQCGGLNNV